MHRAVFNCAALVCLVPITCCLLPVPDQRCPPWAGWKLDETACNPSETQRLKVPSVTPGTPPPPSLYLHEHAEPRFQEVGEAR